MNDSIFPSIHPASPPDHPGVYADMAELVRMKFRTCGFLFLPRQPVHSTLASRHASRLRGRGLNFEEVASLSGAAWLNFLDRAGHTNVFTRGRGQLLSELAYDPRLMTQLDSSAVEALFTIVRQWIRGHSAVAEIVATRS